MEKTIYRQTETLSSVAAGATGSVEAILNGFGHVRLLQVEAVCGSSDFDLYLLDKEDGAQGSINEVYHAANVDQKVLDDEFYAGGRLAFNSDTTPVERLYAKVKNNDQQNATGPISLRLYFTTVAHSELS
ncbi:MAG: hypothetical protein DRH70_07555 [Candidatus Coatesbacteria bacterium]|nr:MAG: hypothetical protein DRH70_07555 [Candidatus Coatesbacteria bacterium]